MAMAKKTPASHISQVGSLLSPILQGNSQLVTTARTVGQAVVVASVTTV